MEVGRTRVLVHELRFHSDVDAWRRHHGVELDRHNAVVILVSLCSAEHGTAGGGRSLAALCAGPQSGILASVSSGGGRGGGDGSGSGEHCGDQ